MSDRIDRPILEVAAKDVIAEINRCIEMGEAPSLRQIRWWGGHLSVASEVPTQDESPEAKLKALQKEIDRVAYVGTVNGVRAIWFSQESVFQSAFPRIAEAVEDVDLRRDPNHKGRTSQ
jgi:hypothetical protein